MAHDWTLADTLLDHLLLLQREEQQAILERHPLQLPEICGRIDSLVRKLDACGVSLAAETPPPARPPETVLGKLRQVRDLAEQNHLLIQNHLRFLQDVFSTVFPERRQNQTYDALGRMAASISQAGMLLDTHS